MKEKTVFELIIEGKIPCNKVLENNDFLAFHDIAPKAPIHILIIPKKHFKDFQEFDPKLMEKMTSFIQELAVLLGVDKSGYRLVTNCGKNSGQEVFHLHFHMLGGFRLPKEKDENENPQALF
ncbi:histidine triad nucleotide-binding protein [Campylobacter coli]|uniref:histidine triad nucleotide-binding protein n=2 Tax=Campylobacter coli TaxID=195 RepID=UPI00025809D6|nr:histidine triad nucleotide-binding protein [Campylobacter coli]EAC1969140.1 histidine triad nucleotide-binding protein [Campylobacter coli]EAC1970742.1 histidine triad nucleotide-binding protein [Campylobacter coli]EAC2029797.1 histidine triad nucleotide-binding protein [Campylobacter coli]EAH4842027.1 histidine triad nucleotide-binding protein [Campylobacter coli]EAH4942118.1 histidine triad nucleotide-binding protein [Campylobacter coli]